MGNTEEPGKEIMEAATIILYEIPRVKAKHKYFRKGSKQNFNFFEGLVNSGKSTKTHIEKYHSNFISYLLNPKAGHDCEFHFLHKYLSYLETTRKLSLENFKRNMEFIKVEREKHTVEHRSIDITIESGNDWIIFIENKVRSNELENQVKDYAAYCKDNYTNWLGIYLTIDGIIPPSVNKMKGYEKNVIPFSYWEIIGWLKDCMSELIQYPNITSALSQYVNSIYKLYNLTTEEMKEITKLIIEREQGVEAAFAVANSIEEVKRELVAKVNFENDKFAKDNFLTYNPLKDLGCRDSGFTFERPEWNDFKIYFYFEENNYGDFCFGVGVQAENANDEHKKKGEEIKQLIEKKYDEGVSCDWEGGWSWCGHNPSEYSNWNNSEIVWFDIANGKFMNDFIKIEVKKLALAIDEVMKVQTGIPASSNINVESIKAN